MDITTEHLTENILCTVTLQSHYCHAQYIFFIQILQFYTILLYDAYRNIVNLLYKLTVILSVHENHVISVYIGILLAYTNNV